MMVYLLECLDDLMNFKSETNTRKLSEYLLDRQN